MEKTLIALNPTSEALSSADFKKSPESQHLLDLNGQERQAMSYTHNSLNSFKEFIAKVEADRVEKQQQRREAEQAKERQERLRSIKQGYEWKLKKAENLKLAYAMLINKKDKIELIPNFEQKVFLETISENLNAVELWLLADKVRAMYEALDSKINNITSCDDEDLYYEFHQYDPKFETVTCAYNGEPDYEYGAYLPTPELAEMQAENNLLYKLSCELNDLIAIEANETELEQLRQALIA